MNEACGGDVVDLAGYAGGEVVDEDFGLGFEGFFGGAAVTHACVDVCVGLLFGEGVEVASHRDAVGEADLSRPPDASQVFIGRRCDGFANWEGKIAEVAVCNRALTAEEAARHYAAADLASPA